MMSTSKEHFEPSLNSKEENRPVLQCVKATQKDRKLTLIASYGFRLAMVSLDFEDGEGEALISASELVGLTPALRKAKRIRLGFQNGGERLDSSSLIFDTELVRYKWQSQDGEYPDYGKVILEAKEDRGKAEIEADTSGEVKTAVSARYLAQALKACGGIVELKASSPNSPMMFCVDGYRLLVMPMATVEDSPPEAESPKETTRREGVELPPDEVREPVAAKA